MTRKIIHIDMDCFYAAIEVRDNPVLLGKPVAVGGKPNQRGVICSANYEARKFGVKSAMATSTALKNCPDLVLVPVNMHKYKLVSQGIQAIFRCYTDLVEPLSLDEAYLDVTDCKEYSGSATLIAEAIRQEIFDTHFITASAGVASNKFLAKVGSGWKKPNSQTVIIPSKIAEFVAPLAVEQIWGVGKKTAEKLQAIGMKTCADLQTLTLEQLIQQFGKFGTSLYEFCRGIDEREVEPNRVAKSRSIENTYLKDLPDLEACMLELPELYAQLQFRLKHHNYPIAKQFVKLKFHNFTHTTVECQSLQLSLQRYELLCKEAYQRYQVPVRLIGLGVQFADENNLASQQMLLFE
ncbi:MAG: DNA polymerase IV [Gammaproteobacteria bacterium]|nr:DNA polymerase IV [Gammaproteobacteria bacterium]